MGEGGKRGRQGKERKMGGREMGESEGDGGEERKTWRCGEERKREREGKGKRGE